MSVVGFDIGNENCVIGVVKQRGIDVLLNNECNRETPSIVSFGEKQRFLGSAGAANATTNLKSTVSQIKRLIGRKYADPSVQNDLKILPFQTSEGSDGGVLIHLQYLNRSQTFTPVQIMAMLFAHLKQIAEKNLEMPVSDCVIGIPSYFTDSQRRSYLNAAEISGLNPLRLMHDCTAAALGYGIYKADSANMGPSNVVFVDIGHCDTQVVVTSFEQGHMKILSHAFDANLGGRDFDEVLFVHFAAEFKEQYNIDVSSNTRASMRLRSSCEKLKKILSANAEAPLNIECLMEEKDVKGFIKREDFEKLSSGLLERIRIPCLKALADSGLSVERINSIELVGSGSRIPAISRSLTSLFGKEPTRKLNTSECIARGCALQCAMLSPTFRVREYEVQDSFPFSIGFMTDEGPIKTNASGVLFPRGHHFPSVKMLRLQRSSTFLMEAFYADQTELPACMSPKISCFTIGPFHVHQHEVAKIKVKVHLDLNGIVAIESASLLEDQIDNGLSKSNTNHSSHKRETVSSDGDDNDSAQSNQWNTSAADAKATQRQTLHVTEDLYGSMTKDEIAQAREIEVRMVQQDRTTEQTKERKNALESYVYETRNKLLNTFRIFTSDSEKEVITGNLQQTEDWLYEDGDDESEEVYAKKLEDLRKLVDPIENRYKDEEARAQATRDLLKLIVEYRMAVGSLSPSEMDGVLSECNKAEQWLRDKSQQQEALPKNTDPILWSSEIRRKVDTLDAMCKHIMRSNSRSSAESDHRNEHDNMRID